jgi:photosynthetic reaction center cytochrome c subunit
MGRIMKVDFQRIFRSSGRVFLLGAALAASLMLVFIASAQQPRSAAPESEPAAAAHKQDGKFAEDVYKNIKSLRGQPATQLIPTMQFISASLGVQCEFCHDMKAFDKDTKDEKRAAREMIAMQEGNNKGHFKGKREVTCNTCHHGEMHPGAIPALPELTAALPVPVREHEHGTHQTSQIAPAEYLNAFFQAAGGEAALAKLTSRTERGTVSFGPGADSRFESYTRSNGQRATALFLQQGTALTTFGGHTGWFVYPGRHSREMSAGEIAASRVEADFEFPVNFKQKYPQLRVAHPETVNGKPANVLQASRPGEPPVRLYFDAASHLLIRVIYYVETPLGRNPTQIDVLSYADSSGLQLPSRWVVTRPASRTTYTVVSTENNVPIDEDKFTPSAASQAADHPATQPAAR